MTGEPERHVSPDGRTILIRDRAFHPADGHEIRPLYFPRVVDADSGETVLDLTGGVMSFDFAWEEDGTLMLTAAGSPFPEPDPLRVRLSVAGGWFEMSEDGWTRHPLAEAQGRVTPLAMRRNDLPVRRDRAGGRGALRLWVGGAALLMGMAAFWVVFSS